MMQNPLRTALLALALVVVGSAGYADEVKLDGLTSKTPAGWKEETPSNRMRLAQYRLPAAKGDKTDAELTIFSFGGTSAANIARWKAQFIPPEGKKIDDVSKVETIKIGGKEATLLDISGTYKAQPVTPNGKEELLAGYRMLAINFQGPDKQYQIKLYGPAATIEKHKKEFDEWVKGFK